jgi:magnesium-transporting ATPase (P-type)
MMAIGFNGFNARTEHMNVFEHLGRNRNFLLVMGGVFVLQYLFVTCGGEVLRVMPLNPRTWAICLAAAFMVIPLDLLRKSAVNARKRRKET